MVTNKTLLNFIVDENLLKRIEDFRFKNRFPSRAAAIKWLLDWALKQKPPVRGPTPEPEEDSVEVAEPVPARNRVAEPTVPEPEQSRQTPEPLARPEPVAGQSVLSITQALRDHGYEVGDAAHHPDGVERILVRSRDRSAWVNVAQELQDLAAGRVALAEIASKRAAGK